MSLLLLVCAILSCWHPLIQGRRIEQQPLVDDSANTLLHERRLNFSSPAPHIFSSVHGLLRQGYNTFFPHGFSVVPCEIPAFTPFYHGWLNDEPPQSPEWLASSPEMAYGIMGSTRNSFLSTYQTTRSAKCLYFDGASGALGENGTMDTQMLFLYGNTTGPPGKNSSGEFLWDEYARAQRLCGWLRERKLDAPGQGIEGIVRMSAGFELVWCNFSSPSLRLVSRFNVSVPLLGYNRTSSLIESPKETNPALFATEPGDSGDLPAPDWEIDWEHEPFVASQQWDWFTSASRAYSSEDLASNREPSIRLLDVDVVSLYSPEYQGVLATLTERERERLNLTADGFWQGTSSREPRGGALKELMRRRSRHRAGNLSPPENARFRQDMERMVSRIASQDPHVSLESRDIPWSHTCDTIVNSFARRLMHFQRLLQHDYAAEREAPVYRKRRFASLRERAHALLMPFFEYSSDIGTAAGIQQHPENIQSSLNRCKSAYLPWPVRDEVQEGQPKGMGHYFVGQAIEEVMDGICSMLVGAGVSIETTWRRHFNHDLEKTDETQLQRSQAELQKWQDKIEELTAWLGWSPHWTGCGRLCAWDEECYIPMWPVFRQLSAKKPAYGNRPVDPAELEYDLWHPRCVKIAAFAAR